MLQPLFCSEAFYLNIYLSFNLNAGQCDGNPGGTCSRTQMFSNSDPAYTVNGRPIGNTHNDNARKINESKSIVAGYFPFQETCQSNADFTTSEVCNPGVCNGVCSFPPLDCEFHSLLLFVGGSFINLMLL
mmetsp:Transcript_19793/g.35953  ORF Transcript_19793/g.35953 Transcript_19793/m.35953 type:complete len:130 (-) Transcript_19793:1139-1528(-)